MELLVDCKSETGVSSGEAGLEGIFEGKEKGERKLKTGLVGRSKPESVKDWKYSSGPEESEKQSSHRGKFECIAA